MTSDGAATAEETAKKPDPAPADADRLTIIGIGSSAGGLEAIRELVSNLPADAPVSYVIVQHMSPHHKSLMTELVGRETDLAVADVTDGLRPERNHIYVTPPKIDVLFRDGRLRLVQPKEGATAPKPSVDRFLQSLAEDHGEATMAIILSGTGKDGAYGVQAIREAGGITIAQDASSAKYDGMPNAAIQTGCVDLILSPGEIAGHLHKILRSPRDFDALRRGELEQSPINDLLQILLARTRVDFRDYKQTTVIRRIERRMLALGIDNKDDYASFCRANPRAVDDLYKDLLISVTRFFRDRAEFDDLAQHLPDLLDMSEGSTLRVWIAGCATGEEAYTIAMLLAEALGGPDVPLKSRVQIIATDIDERALQVARRGVYGIAALDDIPPKLASRYLVQDTDTVRVIDNLRSAILFAHHNVCQDPPFRGINLLCCRNLLIYFNHALQLRVLRKFHYAMTENSLLFLGTAESVSGSEQIFVNQRQSSHIYHPRQLTVDRAAMMADAGMVTARSRGGATKADPGSSGTDRRMFEALMRALGRDSILVSHDHLIMRVNGNVTPFVHMTEASPLKMNLDLLRRPLREEARSLVTLAIKHGEMRRGVRHDLGREDGVRVQLSVYPLVAPEIDEKSALVVFGHVAAETRQVSSDGTEAVDNDRVMALESEIATTREALQQTIEELETSNEELQSVNEELQSTNEELQAANEELETSNEELQSTNEELITVNEELQVTTAELDGRTAELTSVLEGAPIPILVLDNALQIVHASGQAVNLFRLRRPLSSPHVSQCTVPDGFPALTSLCADTIRLGEKLEMDITSNAAMVKLTTSPFLDDHGQIRGATLMVTTFPRLAAEMEAILNSAQVHIMNRTADGTIRQIGSRAAESLSLTRETAPGENLHDHLDVDSARQIARGDRELLKGSEDHGRELVAWRTRDDSETRWLWMDRFVIDTEGDHVPSIYSVSVDVTEEIEARQGAEDHIAQLMLIQEISGIGYWHMALDTQKLTWSDEVFRIHGLTPGDPVPDLKSAIEFYHPDDRDTVRAALHKTQTTGERFGFRLRLTRADGETVPVAGWGLGKVDSTGRVRDLLGAFRRLDRDPDTEDDA